MIATPYIKLDQVMKLAAWVDSGAQAKICIQEGEVFLNGAVCTQRGKKVRPGDCVEWDGMSVVIK